MNSNARPPMAGSSRFSTAVPASPESSIGSLAGPSILRTVGGWHVGGRGRTVGCVVGLRPGWCRLRHDIDRLGRGCRTFLVEHRVQVGGELRHQLLADVAHDASAELGDLARDAQVGLDSALGLVVRDGLQRGRDHCVGVALAGGVTTLAVQHRAVVRVVAFDEVGLVL